MASMYAGNGMPNGPIPHMPGPGPHMHPPQMPHQMPPGMRPMQHPGQPGHMIHHPQMSMGQPMNMNNMAHMHNGGPPSNMYGNPQMNPALQGQIPPHMFQPQQPANAAHQQQVMQQRRLQAQQNSMMQGGHPGHGMHPGMLKSMQHNGQLPPEMQARLAQQQRNMNMQNQLQQGPPQNMQRQASMQGGREHTGPPQPHPGQQPGQQMPPHTPQNPQLQRNRQGPPTSQAPSQQPQSQQQGPPSSQPPPQQNPPEGQQQNPQGPGQPTPQPQHTVPPGTGMSVNFGNMNLQQPQRQQPMLQNQDEQQQPQVNQGARQAQMNPQLLAQQQYIQRNNQNFNNHNMKAEVVKKRLGIEYLHALCFSINELSASTEKANLSKWQELISKAFFPDGTFRMQVLDSDTDATKDFEIDVAVLGRWFMEHCTRAGVSRFQISIGGGQLENIISLHEVPATFAYYLDNGSQVVASGSLKLDYEPKPGNLFRSVEFLNVKHEEFLSRRALESLAIPEQKQSPEKSKMTAKQKQMQSRVRIIPYEQLPPSPCGDFGIFSGMQQFLERIDVMSRMRPLFDFHQHHPTLRAEEVLQQYNSQPPEQQMPLNGQINMAQLGQQQHQYANFLQGDMQQPTGPMRTPGLNGPGRNANYFPSPAHANMGLSSHASPYMGTPPPGQQMGMQAPAMMAQGSTQGVNPSTNPSSNASPNVNGKRRRGSVAKIDTGDGSDGMGPPPPAQNGGQNKVKQSPRPGKKQKGT